MTTLPESCPRCERKGIAYSVGVIRNSLGAQFEEYPVVWCEPCHAAYFTRLPFATWDRCDVNKRVIAFTKDPGKIDRSIKLEYDFKLVGSVKIYSVYPASKGETHV
jgi:hypothetical protein